MFLAIQRLVLLNKNVILKLFFLAEIGVAGFYLGGVWLFFSAPEWQFAVFELGGKFGQLAVGFYMLTLVPGILQRLRLFQQWATLFMLFRRQLGVMTFLCAWAHSGFTTWLFVLQLGSVEFLGLPQLMGIVALSIFIPMWLTSNDFSQRFLGKKWKLLHRFTYVALLFILAHLVFMKTNWAIPAGMMLIFEIISWLVYWFRPQPAVISSPETVQ